MLAGRGLVPGTINDLAALQNPDALPAKAGSFSNPSRPVGRLLDLE